MTLRVTALPPPAAATFASRTLAVWMPSRSAACSVRITRLSSLPSIGSTLTASPRPLSSSVACPREHAETPSASAATSSSAATFHRLPCCIRISPLSWPSLSGARSSPVDRSPSDRTELQFRREVLGLRARREPQVAERHQQRADQRRGQQAAEDDHGEWAHHLEARHAAEERQRQHGQPDRQRGQHRRHEPLPRPAQDQLDAELVAFLPLQALQVPDEQ